MRKGRFSEEQIIAILKENEAGVSPSELCRRHGISDATFYNWRKKYGGLEVSEARRLKTREDENARLKKLRDDKLPMNPFGMTLAGLTAETTTLKHGC